jgi:hypothetical protein
MVAEILLARRAVVRSRMRSASIAADGISTVTEPSEAARGWPISSPPRFRRPKGCR